MKLRSLVALPLASLLVALPTWAEDKKDDKDVTVVVAEGVGTTADDALKDAFRNAVRQVVGAVVDAETLVKNDEVISDKVLTYSGGFVKKYEEVSKKEEKGLFRIKIKATVERRSVVAKLKEARVTVKDVAGQDLFSEAVTQEEAKKNATELLVKALSGLPPLLTAEAVSKPEYDSTDKKINLDVRLKVDRKAYGEYQKKLNDLLKKISLGEDSATFEGKGYPVTAVKGYETDHLANLLSFEAGTRSKGIVTSIFAGPKLDAKSKATCCLWMNTFANESHKTTKWNAYVLDADPVKVLAALRGKNKVTISFADDKGELVTEDQFELPIDPEIPQTLKREQHVLPVLWEAMARKKDGSPEGYNPTNTREITLKLAKGEKAKVEAANIILSPFFLKVEWSTVFYQPEVVLHRQIGASLDELKRIKKVECKVQFRQ